MLSKERGIHFLAQLLNSHQFQLSSLTVVRYAHSFLTCN